MNKAQRARLDTVAAQFGATVDVSETSGHTQINLDAPAGQRWIANGCHAIAGGTSNARAAWVALTVTEVLAEAVLGLEPCSDPDCETCDRWIPACGGTETPFTTRTGRRLLYCWNPATGRHAYLDCGTDLILTDDEARLALDVTK